MIQMEVLLDMKNYCVVISEITRKEVDITASSEKEAIKTAEKQIESGEIPMPIEDGKKIIFHIKY